MKEWSIFFPDLGDEMKVKVKQLRITQDWDESTENWILPKSFENGLVEEKRFGNVKELWRDIVVEVIGDHYTLTQNEFRLALKLPENLLEGGSYEPPDDVYCDDASHGNEIGSDNGITNRPKENGDSSNMLDANQNCGSTTSFLWWKRKLRRKVFYMKSLNHKNKFPAMLLMN
ncbi:unnamed protein product [Trifolium pratense]|uniref:Uncharacterized protein n=1 Tax=Trifolium pratense TaxID=57577 RepID=A0ACB0KCG4_TRIPR|nr:unnamed protein product [Trifolium pratense]